MRDDARYNIEMNEGVLVLGASEAQSDPQSPARLEGQRLRVARWGWILLAIMATAILVTSLPGYFSRFSGTLSHSAGGEPGSLSHFLAIGGGAASLVTSLLSLGLALMLFQRRFEEPAVAALSLYLLGYGIIMAGPLEFWANYWFGTASFASVFQALLMSSPTIALFALFPNGRFEPKWMRWILLGSIPMAIALILLGPYEGSQVRDQPITYAILGFCFAILILFSMYAQVYRYRNISTETEREQTKWVVFGFVLWFVWIVVSTGPYLYLTSLPAGSSTPWWASLSELLWWISLALPPLSLTISITRFRLWNIDFLINRTLVFASLTFAISALYIVVIAGLGYLFRDTRSSLVSILATASAVLAFQPLRARLQQAVNRMMYGERDDPVAILSKLADRLGKTSTPEATLNGIVETLAQALKLPYVAISLGDQKAPTAAYGMPVETPERIPLTFQGQPVGTMFVARRTTDEELTPKDWRLLENISQQAGAVAYSAHLTVDLLRARQRLVRALEEERRRIRRDLHDGLGPQLASLSLKLDAARNLLGSKPERAAELLDQSKQQIRDSVDDIRRLVYNLRPPALDELGLMSALQEHAAAFREGGTQVYIDGPSQMPELPAAVEVASFRIIQEAINNAARHGNARHCWVRIQAAQALELSIEDDGSGLPRNLKPGVGITSMRERSSELGGSFQIDQRPVGGTRISVSLPLNMVG